jgi:hypothetical protein
MWERLAIDPYFRSGTFGLCFCLGGIIFTHLPVFLFGAGFFAALLASSVLFHRKVLKREGQSEKRDAE